MSDIQKVIQVYNENGIVTRKDVNLIDSRVYGRKLIEEIKNMGYEEACYSEVHSEGYLDYTGVLFNSEVYSYEEAKNYVFKNVFV